MILFFNFLFGAALATRFKVPILIPASCLILAIGAGLAFVQGRDFFSAIIELGLSTVVLQLGYLAGVVAVSIWSERAIKPYEVIDPAPSDSKRFGAPARPH